MAGVPFFDVSSVAGPSQIEVRYGESFVSLLNVNSDGPWTFSNGLANSFRVETFNLTETGISESFFVQGGQRWMTVRLLTGAHVTFNNIGFQTTSAHNSTDAMPGLFRSSDDVLNRIWNLGANNAQVACVDAGKAPSTWTITEDGALIRGQQTAQSSVGITFANYTLDFESRIISGGIGWTVASGTSPYGAKFYITVDYDKNEVYANTNISVVPSNSLTFGYPWSIVNQTTLETGPRSHYPIAASSISSGEWYRITTAIQTNGYNVSVDGTPIAFIPYETIGEEWLGNSNFGVGSGSVFNGTWGFGPWQDQAAYVRNVQVTAQNGSLVYENKMTTPDVLDEFSVAALNASVCLDGAKRDRLVWIGDFYHTSRILTASTARSDYVLGTIGFEFQRQRQEAPAKYHLPISPRLGSTPESDLESLALYTGLLDYQFLFLAGVADYYFSTADLVGLKPFWEGLKRLAEAMTAFIDPNTGLIAGSAEISQPSFFLGPANGSAVTGLASYVYQKLSPLAIALGDHKEAARYEEIAAKLSDAVNKHLWDESLGSYSEALDAPSNFSLTAVAWTIMSNTANISQTDAMVRKLPELRLGVGYKTDTSVDDSDDSALSPNLSGFLLDALFHAHRRFDASSLDIARTLLLDFWSQMVIQDQYDSGAGWEYMYPDGSPGLDLFTSLAHPWGAAPTYVLPKYVLGVTASSPGFQTWVFRPLLWPGIGLTEANGRVDTPFGSIHAGWKVIDGGRRVEISINAPPGTTGVLVIGEEKGSHKITGDGETTTRMIAM